MNLVVMCVLLIVAFICTQLAEGYEKAMNSPWVCNDRDKQLYFSRLKLCFDFLAYVSMAGAAWFIIIPLADLIYTWMETLPSGSSTRMP